MLPVEVQKRLIRCQRCEREIEEEKTPFVSTRSRRMYFCDTCFRAVFKYDESLKTIQKLWEENGKKIPFTVRSMNWHRSSYMVVKDVKSSLDTKKGKDKTVFIGDMFLRGELKEQDKPIGKANHFNWVSWSDELAQKYRESSTVMARAES